MGYYMEQRDSDFTIKQENIQKAWDALIKLFETKKRHYSWVDTRSVLEASSFRDAMEEARWVIYYDNNREDVCGILFNGEKYGGDEIIILGAIAPYVEDGSYIEMSGEDGAIWRWVFNDGDIEEKNAKIVWE